MMNDLDTLKTVLVIGVYLALLLLLLRPAGSGPDMLTHAGLALAAVAGA
jgi:hypothetical protein